MSTLVDELSLQARARLAWLQKEELAGEERQRARQSRRERELLWVQTLHPGSRVKPEQPKIPLPDGFLNSHMVADYVVFDNDGNLRRSTSLVH